MKSGRQFANPFLASTSTYPTAYHPRINQSSRQLPHFQGMENIYTQNSKQNYPQSFFRFSSFPVKFNQSSIIQQNSNPNSLMYQSQVFGKQSTILERSRSQIIQPIYVSPMKNSYYDSLNQSKQLGLSRASQVTFSKPSDFIMNSPKEHHIQTLSQFKKHQISPSQKIIHNDYGYSHQGSIFNLNVGPKSNQNIFSPMKQSYMQDIYNPVKNSVIMSQSPKIKIIDKVVSPSKIVTIRPTLTQFPFRNQSSQLSMKLDLRRALSTVSIMSNKSMNSSLGKIKFNYISPAKSQNKMQRKLSFKKQDVKNPLSKLTNKKSPRSKLLPPAQKKVNNEVVNEYFPQFKIKKGKLKPPISPKSKIDELILQKKQSNKSQISEDDERRNTFIAGLDALSQISDIKQKEKERQDSTQLSNDTPRKNANFDTRLEHQETEKRNSFAFSEKKSTEQNEVLMSFGKESMGNRLKQSLNYKEQSNPTSQNQSRASRDSQLSVNSAKNNSSQFVKKHYTDSSHTTDYEDEIVRKIKHDLGLNYSYHKK